jgi:hypothetical protein
MATILETEMTKRRPEAKIGDDFARILDLATQELIFRHGGLFVATAVRETLIKSIPVWIISVALRYPTGHEGYVGDLLYDGDLFTFLTPQSIVDERVRLIDADPENNRKWNEYRNPASRAGKA